MSQAALGLDRKRTALTFVHARPAAFRSDFAAWLDANWPIYEVFEREALKVKRSGREHYSARTIGEYLRHHTLVTEANSDFKVNDHVWPDLARLAMLMNGALKGFFETRVAPTSGRVAA